MAKKTKTIPALDKKYEALCEQIFRMTQPELKEFLRDFLERAGYKLSSSPTDKFIYAKGSLPVTLLAHMDTVHKEKVSEIYKSSSQKWTALEGIGGDDRCGVIIIMRLIGSGYRPTVIFTEDEEVGCLGAQAFSDIFLVAPKGTKYMIEFDRANSDDCVFYRCDNEDFTKYVESFGFKRAWGSYSDICEIAPYWKIAAVNLSSGYYHAHTTGEVVDMWDIEKTIARAKKMLDDADSDTTPVFEYIPSSYATSRYYSGWSRFDDYDYDNGYDYDYNGNYSYGNYSYSYSQPCGSYALPAAGEKWLGVSCMTTGYILEETPTCKMRTNMNSYGKFYYIDKDANVYEAGVHDITHIRKIGGTAYKDDGSKQTFSDKYAVLKIVKAEAEDEQPF